MSFLTDRLKKKADPSFHGFDLPERHLFSAKSGYVLPILAKPMVIGDKFDIDVIEQTQTLPFNKAAFFRAKKYFHFWFVPYSLMWTKWDEFLTQRKNPYSAVDNGSAVVPHFQYSDLLKKVICLHDPQGNDLGSPYNKNMFGERADEDAIRLADLFGFGNWAKFKDATSDTSLQTLGTNTENYFVINDLDVSAFVPGAYQLIWNYAYRNKYFDTDIDPTYYNFDDINCETGRGNLVTEDSIDRVAKLFTLRYRQWDHDMFMGLLPSSQYGEVATLSASNFQLINALDASNTSLDTLAERQGSKLGATKPSNSNSISTAIYDSSGNLISGSSYWSIPQLFDVIQLRKAEAMQKWRETTLRNGRRANDQYEGHFGMKSDHATDHSPIYVGGFDSRILCDPVTATSNTEGVDSDGNQNIGSVLGQLAGKGVSASTHGHIKFEAHDFGVLMCMFSIVPEADYDNNQLDKQHTLLEPFDFFTPELENLGFEPVTQSELSIMPITYKPASIWGGNRNNLTQVPTGFNPNSILGYLPRYHVYKTSVDRLHGEFASGRSLEAFAVPRQDLLESLYDFGGTAQAPTATYRGLRVKSFYINPNCLDNLFPIAASSSQKTDQFFNLVKFNIKAVRPMSVLGLPY